MDLDLMLLAITIGDMKEVECHVEMYHGILTILSLLLLLLIRQLKFGLAKA